MQRTLVILLLGGTVAFHALIFFASWPGLAQGDSDFVAFYSAGKTVRLGRGPQLYNQQSLANLQNEFAPQLVKSMQGPLPYTHPPFEAAVFSPLASLSYPAAYALWGLISGLALLSAIWLLRPSLPHMRRWSRTLPFLCALAFFPVFWCFFQGQDSTVLLLLIVGAYICLKHHRDFLAGTCLGLALIKFQYVLPLMAIMLLKRRWTVGAGFALTAVALTIASVGVVGWDQTLRYPRTLILLSQAQADGVMSAKTMPNLRGVIESVLGGGGLVANGILAVISVALIGFVARRCKIEPAKPAFALEFSLVVIVSTLLSYHVQRQDLTLLLLPLLLVGEALFERTISLPERKLVLPAVALPFFSPLFILLPLGPILPLGHAYLLVFFWLAVLLAIGLTLALPKIQAATRAQLATSP